MELVVFGQGSYQSSMGFDLCDYISLMDEGCLNSVRLCLLTVVGIHSPCMDMPFIINSRAVAKPAIFPDHASKELGNVFRHRLHYPPLRRRWRPLVEIALTG